MTDEQSIITLTASPQYEVKVPPSALKPSPPTLSWPNKRRPASLMADRPQVIFESGDSPKHAGNRLILGKNLPTLAHLLHTEPSSVDLIYIDPPYDSKTNYTKKIRLRGTESHENTFPQVQYRDHWKDNDYLQFMYERLIVLYELLNDTGSIIIHCDRHRAHHIRCLAEEVFGQDKFRGSIVWGYGGGGAAKRQYPAKHDTLLWFSKSKNWTFNKQYRPYSEGTLKRGLTAVKGLKYSLNEQGAMLNDWWTDKYVQKILSPTANENLKYPTQKPESLLERIILGHSKEGDVVLDCFCGSGTTLAVARRLKRRFIGIDVNRGAVLTTLHRLVKQDKVADAPDSFSLSTTSKAYEEMQTLHALDDPIASIEKDVLDIFQFHLNERFDDRIAETRPGLDFRSYVESVLIDPFYDGLAFRPTIIDIATKNNMVSAKHRLPENWTNIQVWITDIWSKIHRFELSRSV